MANAQARSAERSKKCTNLSKSQQVAQDISSQRNVPMIASYILYCDWGFGCIFPSFSGLIELLPHNQQSAGQLLPVQAIISNQKGLISPSDDECCNVHCGVVIYEAPVDSTIIAGEASGLRIVHITYQETALVSVRNLAWLMMQSIHIRNQKDRRQLPPVSSQTLSIWTLIPLSFFGCQCDEDLPRYQKLSTISRGSMNYFSLTLGVHGCLGHDREGINMPRERRETCLTDTQEILSNKAVSPLCFLVSWGR